MSQPTHAGGVVFRRDPDAVRYLLVTARHQADSWVLPKGHIEDGESPGDTAVREVREESGIEASVVRELGRLEFEGRRGWIRADFFLMEFLRESDPSTEGRSRAWLTVEEIRRVLSFDDARTLIAKAQREVETLR